MKFIWGSVFLGGLGIVQAGSGYSTGNVQFHQGDLHGARATSTWEWGYGWEKGTTLFLAFDGVPVGQATGAQTVAPAITLGGEHRSSSMQPWWWAVGYQHLLSQGQTLEYRPVFKVGYQSSGPWQFRHQFRYQYPESGTAVSRMDTQVSYRWDEQVRLSYNHVWHQPMTSDRRHSQDHEIRTTYLKSEWQPYFEIRQQVNGQNLAWVTGISLAF